jgi:HTH-type transcriptional regulator/antitoxin HigA
MEIKPIRDDRDHDEALREIERVWGAKGGTADGDRLDVLVTLVEAYERDRFPMSPPDPIEAIRFRLDRKALIGVIGTRTRVYEVLRGDRNLTLAMIRRLHDRFGIPAEVLIRPVQKKRTDRRPRREAKAQLEGCDRGRRVRCAPVPKKTRKRRRAA